MNPTPRKPMPRDAGGALEITEGTGPIRAMLSTGELLEIYKSDMTFRVATPETIDPQRTNPNAPFVVSPVQNVGTANAIVARVLLQGDQMLNFTFLSQDERYAVKKQLHACKELLLRCEASADRLLSKVKSVEHRLDHGGVRLKGGRVLNPFPQVEELETDCSGFLVNANRAIKEISGLPALFIPLQKSDNNFEHLYKRLGDRIGEAHRLCQFVKENAKTIRRFVDLRNFLEHPRVRKTIIKNFHIMPDGEVGPPIWHISDESPVLIVDDMFAAIKFLVEVTELLVIHLVVYHGRERLRFAVQKVPAHEVDPAFPVAYKMFASLRNLKAATLDISDNPVGDSK